ncbi:MAG: FtsK/SpoIIIE domain-containing protein, partial [Planctomycetota bacterium]|nr:FtsK/SpoIIIE domain-containing protein [Planctomycetota bacterium]
MAENHDQEHEEQPMMEELFRDRQREALRELIELTAYRGRMEISVQEQYEHDRDENQGEYDTKKTGYEQQREAELSGAKEIHDTSVQQARSQIEAKLKGADLEYHGECERLTDKAAGNLQEAEKLRQEAIWATETVYEAKKDLPHKEYKRNCHHVQFNVKELTGAMETSRSFLKAIFIRTPGIAAAESDAASESAETESFDQAEIDQLLFQLDRHMEDGKDIATAIAKQRLARLLGGFMPWLLILIFAAIGGGVGLAMSSGEFNKQLGIIAGLSGGFAVVLLVIVWIMTRNRSLSMLSAMHERLLEVRLLQRKIERLSEIKRDLDAAELLETRDNEVRKADESYQPIHDEVTKRRDVRLKDLADAFVKRKDILEKRLKTQLDDLERQYASKAERVCTYLDANVVEITTNYEQRKKDVEEHYQTAWSDLETRWFSGMKQVLTTVEDLRRENDHLFMPWTDPKWTDWKPPLVKAPAIRFGNIAIDRNELEGGMPRDERLKIESPALIDLPAALVFPRDCSLLLQYGDEGREQAVKTLQQIMLRLLTGLPPGKTRFTIIDPVGLGESFAGFMHLADFDEQLVTSRIWTEQRHIEQRLADLTEHIENVIQKYLRNEFETIAEYNEKAGEIAEPYRFLVVCDLPSNFTEIAARRLASIINSGPRCGLYTLIGMDTRQKLPEGLELSDLKQHCLELSYEDGRYVWKDEDYGPFPLTLDQPPEEGFLTEILKRVGQASKDTSRVEVPFHVIAPKEDEIWSRNTASEISVPLGRAGATKLQSLELGHGTSQHVLIAGKTGSGKSTLLHALITNLALWCSPDEVEFYLVDFKKGVEFKSYARYGLPHARVIAIESDREFGLSVLQRVDAELRQRGKLYRDLQVQGLEGFRRLKPDTPMPRIMLIIDEFQEFFIEDDKVAQDASLLMDRLVRQGRAFGIHVLLGSQTLGGAYSLARSTMGQMAVRIALQCSEADSYLILSDDNAAARLLARPGEAIYNDSNGAVEGNNPFQAAWVSDE